MRQVIKLEANEMRSDDLLKMVNKSRAEHGESKVEPRHFNARVEDELTGLDWNRKSFTVQNKNKTTSEVYVLNRDQCLLVSMRESKAVRRNVLAKLNQMAEALQQEQSRIASRQAARMEAPDMTAARAEARLLEGKEVKPHLFSNEYNMINKIVLGLNSKQYAEENGLKPSDPIRDTMRPVEIEAIATLQRANTSLIDMGMGYQERKANLQALFNRKFKQAMINEIMRIES